ncbi:hypothetical protein F4801DRAFT_553923 [Xylaria longipes]|nr:hypothetical protein F4801DRAFT_553923 [Xylaria longipes]
MEPLQALPGVTPVRISYHAFLGTVWSGVGISGLTLGCRLYSRYRGPGRVFWDDVFAIASFILVSVSAALWQWAARDMYYVLDVEAGLDTYHPDFVSRAQRWLLVSLIIYLLFYTSLFPIKLSFLYFFRRLGQGIDFYQYFWWPIMFASLVTFIVSISDTRYQCLAGSTDFIFANCNQPAEINKTNATLRANASLDIISDFLTMLLPAVLLWNVRIPTTKKLAVLGLFSLSLFTIAIAAVRVGDLDTTRRPDGQDDVTLLWFWSSIEASVAIVVSSLSAFPQLFAHSHRKDRPNFTPSDTYRQMIARIRSGKSDRRDPYVDLTNISRSVDSDQARMRHNPGFSSDASAESVADILSPSRPVARAYAEQRLDETEMPKNGISQ